MSLCGHWSRLRSVRRSPSTSLLKSDRLSATWLVFRLAEQEAFFLAAGRPALLSARAHARNTHTHAWSMCRVCVCVCLFLWLMRFAKQHFLRVRLAVMMVFRLSKLQTKRTISVLWDFSSWPNLCIRRPVDNSDDQLHKDSDSDSGSYIVIYTGLQKK